MSDELVVRYCAPTLAGLKTANMFTCNVQSDLELMQDVDRLNQQLCYKGIRVLVLSVAKERALIYIYRPDRLADDLNDEIAKGILKMNGYSSLDPDVCILQLIDKLKTNPDFPHEIGLFLGYPPFDVKGFIENKSKKQKCTGYWKVYGDKKSAENTFRKYKKCTKVYYSQWLNGKSIEQLSVAI